MKDARAKKRATRNNARKTKSNGVLDTVSSIGTTAWGLGGYAISEKGDQALVPVGRMMQLQAPAAGKHIAAIIEKTPILGWLKPLEKSGGIIGEISALIMPPLLVGIISSKPELQGIARPIITALMVPIAKDIVQAQKEQATAISSVSDIDEETVEAVQALISMIFPEEGNGDESASS